MNFYYYDDVDAVDTHISTHLIINNILRESIHFCVYFYSLLCSFYINIMYWTKNNEQQKKNITEVARNNIQKKEERTNYMKINKIYNMH
jgi:hypothetical protein